MNKESKENNIDDRLEEVLNNLINEHEQYFGIGEDGGKYTIPASRYDAWMLATVLSNIRIISKLDKVDFSFILSDKSPITLSNLLIILIFDNTVANIHAL